NLAVLAAILVAACAPESNSLSGAPEASSVRAQQRWRFNSQKYSDAGAHPATGRSGLAALQAEALIATDGSVQLAVSSYNAGDLLALPAGVLEKVQVKMFDASGRLLSTRNASQLNG